MIEEYYFFPFDSLERIPACEKCIMMFDIKNEKIDLISHPGEKCANQDFESHNDMYVFEMEGHASFCKLTFRFLWIVKVQQCIHVF